MPKRSDVKPWERQEGESAKAFEAFTIYAGLGADRSLRAVAQQLGKSKTLMDRWSSTYGWVARAAEYDADLQRKAHDLHRRRLERPFRPLKTHFCGCTDHISGDKMERKFGVSQKSLYKRPNF